MRRHIATSNSTVTDRVDSARLRWLLALLLLGLLALVAISVRAHYALGPSGVANQGSGAALLGSIVQVLLVVSVALFELLLVLALIFFPWRRLREAGTRGTRAPRWSRWLMLRMLAIPVLMLVALAVVFVLEAHRRRVPAAASGGGRVVKPGSGHQFLSTVGSVTLPEATAVAAVLGLILAVTILFLRLRSRRPPLSAEEEIAELPQELASAIDQSLVEIAAAADPRQAVIATYERMEGVLARAGWPALSFETPLEYLERVLTKLEASRTALVRLTDLFETARFSTHPVGFGMRAEAEAALGTLRSELTG